MTISSPPSTVRATSILVKISARRFFNRLGNLNRTRWGKKKTGEEGKRKATPGKSGAGMVWMLILLPIFMFNGVMLSTQLITKISSAFAVLKTSGDPKKIPLAEREFNLLRDYPDLDEERLKETFAYDLTFDEEYSQQSSRSSQIDPVRALNEAGRKKLDERVRIFREQGIEAFRPLPKYHVRGSFFPDASIWPRASEEYPMLLALSLVLLLLMAGIFLMSLGSGNQDLGHVDWDMAWLFTFPVRAKSLFLAKTLGSAFLNAFGWLTVYPLTLTICLAAGYGMWSFVLAALSTFYLNLTIASLRSTTETWLRKNAGHGKLKNLQAGCTVVGILLFYSVLYLAIGKTLPDWFLSFTSAAPEAMLFLPTSFPLWFAEPNASLVMALVLVAGAGVLFLWLSSELNAWLVRDGLMRAGAGAYQGARNQDELATGTKAAWFRGIVGKEIRLLLRDRNFLVSTLIVPILIIGFQIMVNPAMFQAGANNFQHAAMLAFGIGAYVLIFGASSILNVERQSLWMLYTFPQSIADLLRQKTRLWVAIGISYVGAVLLVFLSLVSELTWEIAESAAMALVGIIIYARIAGGLGVLGTDPLEQEVQRRMRPGITYVYMLLSAMYSYGIYTPHHWSKLVLVVLCSLLAFAIWQKVKDQIPFLLDPTQAPPPSISLSDGLIAVFAFFVIQGFISILMIQSSKFPSFETRPDAKLITMSYFIAGLVVALLALFFFWKNKVPNLLQEVGLKPKPNSKFSQTKSMALGVAGGLLVAAIGLIYLKVVQAIPAFKELQEQALLQRDTMTTDQWIWFLVLCVVGAPLFEEFIFRGILFKGLRRSFSAPVAICASAAIFGIVHPPFSTLPVAILGATAAICFEKTGLLIAPILAHATYNAIMFLYSTL